MNRGRKLVQMALDSATGKKKEESEIENTERENLLEVATIHDSSTLLDETLNNEEKLFDIENMQCVFEDQIPTVSSAVNSDEALLLEIPVFIMDVANSTQSHDDEKNNYLAEAFSADSVPDMNDVNEKEIPVETATSFMHQQIIHVQNGKPAETSTTDNNIHHYIQDNYNLEEHDSEVEVEVEDANDVDYIPMPENELQDNGNLTGTATGRPKKGRKRKFVGQTFKTKSKLQHSNKNYYTHSGKPVHSKHFIENYECPCKKRCHTLFSDDDRRNIFDEFYKLANYNSQTSFIAANIKEESIKRKRVKNSEKRSHTRLYYLKNQTVCKTFFEKTLRISSKRINTAVSKLREGTIRDRRGEQQGGKNKLTDAVVEAVIKHIKKFPTYKSHYCRATTQSLYLGYNITERKMYELFLEENLNFKLSFTIFKKIFYENFNLRRKPLVKDTCSVCDRFKASKSQQNTKEAHEKHLQEAEIARQTLKADMKEAEEVPDLETITYDMEKTLPLPNIPTNLVFYKRQLWLYNEGVHCGKNGYCFVWKEGTAGRGAQEVGSVLKKFIEEYLNPNTKTLIMWSDSCGGQNRNIKIVLMMKTILRNHQTLETVYFKYLVPGHSFLPNDSDFSFIEKAIKMNQRIYTSNDYINIMKNCRHKRPLTVTEMKKEDFFSVQAIERAVVNRKQDQNKEKVSWLKTRVIKITKGEPFSIFFKYTHNNNDVFKEINIQKNLKKTQSKYFNTNLELLWPEGKEISTKKLADLKALMPFIPADAKQFYKNLKGAEFEDDLEGFGPDLDYENEFEEETNND